MAERHLIALFGPTGVGKTAVAVALADALRARGEVPVAVGADALQLYRGLEILSGAADALAVADRLEHRLIACLPVWESCSAGRYGALAHAEIDGLLAEGRRPILVGGTGLYLRAALSELDLAPPVDPALRGAVLERLEREGPEALHRELAAVHPEVAARIAPGDRQRVGRALELIAAGQTPAPPGQQLWSAAPRRPSLLVGLELERGALRERIDARIDAMLAAGVVAEVAAAAAAGAGPSAAKAVGFRELLAGDVETMRIRTRQYARRQLTWMRKLPDVHRVDLTELDAAAAAASILTELDHRDGAGA